MDKLWTVFKPDSTEITAEFTDENMARAFVVEHGGDLYCDLDVVQVNSKQELESLFDTLEEKRGIK